MTELLAHSPLGGSGSYRWLPEPYGGGCLASVSLSEGVHDEESEYAELGTAAHVLGAECLLSNHDAWEYMGQHIDKDSIYTPDPGMIPDDDLGWVTKDMADAVQMYLDHVRHWHPDRNQGNSWVERRFHCPEVHELFYGTADFVYLEGNSQDATYNYGCKLHVWDYKHGAGIVVEVQRNPQLMYYAIGALTDLDLWDQVDEVTLHVAQPRGWHHSGPVREWSISTVELARWRDEVLVPGMNAALGSDMAVSGEHCRFCPARGRACPQIITDVEDLHTFLSQMKDKEMTAAQLTHEQVGWLLDTVEVGKIAAKAARETGYARASEGHKIPGWKLVNARANRVWKDGAEAAAKKKFGAKKAMVPVDLKSPSGIEELPMGKAFATEWAFKPNKGFQLVPNKDQRSESGPSVKTAFKPLKKGKK